MRFVDHRRISRICVAIAMVAMAAAARAQVGATDEASASAPESASTDGSTPDNSAAADWTPQSWQQHVQEERWRIENLAMLRKLLPADASQPTIEELERQASEKAFSDSTLERGDIIVTTKGFFVFKGQASDQRLPDDFEKIKSSALAPAGQSGR